MLVKDNVNVSNFLQGKGQLGNAANASKTDKKNETSNFSSFLTLAGTNGNSNEMSVDDNVSTLQKNVAPVTETSVTVDKSDDSQKIENGGKKDTTNDFSKDSQTITEKEDVKVSDDMDSKVNELDDSSNSVMDSNMSEEISDEEQELVLETVGQIFQMIMDAFQLSSGELTAKLDEFGMDAVSLLTSEGLREFFLNMESADVSDLLVNEELNLKLQEFMDEFNQIMEQMESVNMNSDFSALDSELDVLLAESSRMQKESMETDVASTEKSSSDSESLDVIADEPEVVISKTETTNDTEKQTGKQDEENSLWMEQQGGKMTEKTTVNKESSFENPILQALEHAVTQAQGNAAVANNGMVSGTDIIKQIVEQVRLNMNQDNTTMELQLNPEHLGKVQINVASKEGVMTARIVVETEAAKQAVENGLASLKETLEQQNLKVDAIEVLVSTTGFEEQDEQQDSYNKESETKAKKKINLAELEEDVSKGEEAETLKMKVSGNSVSYMA